MKFTKKLLLLLLIFIILCTTLTYCKKEEQKDEYTCTLTIECKTALANPDLSPDKKDILPKDGVFAKSVEISFNEGNTAFDVLKAYTKDNKLHLDFENTTFGAYINAIGNLYAGDCGKMSGWMFKANGEASQTSCSEFKLSDGDTIEFLYSCDFGADIGIEM